MFQLSENNFFSSSVAVHEERNDEKIFLVIPTIVRRSSESGAVVADNSPRARKHGL